MEKGNYQFIQIKKGDKESFESLFKTYYAPLCLFARNYIPNNDDCEELVQAFFLNLWEKRKELTITSSVKNYLFSSVRNRCFNYLKHQRIKQTYQTAMLNSSEADNFDSIAFLEIDLMEKINSCIESLPPKRKEIFLLSREQGLKYREIAEQLGISIKTVEAQMGLALKDLRDQLKDYKGLLISFLVLRKKSQ